jgi:hypothetical protein
MNRKDTEDIAALIGKFKQYPQIIEAIVMVTWWDGFEKGLREQNPEMLKHFDRARAMEENIVQRAREVVEEGE